MTLTGNFDKLNKAKTDAQEPEKVADEKEIENYPTPGQTRNLCLVQPDGQRLFLNYAYLISGAYAPEDNSIVLAYTTHTVTIKGRNLEGLYESLMNHQAKQITCIDKRYAAMKKENEVLVTDLIIERSSS